MKLLKSIVTENNPAVVGSPKPNVAVVVYAGRVSSRAYQQPAVLNS